MIISRFNGSSFTNSTHQFYIDPFVAVSLMELWRLPSDSVRDAVGRRSGGLSQRLPGRQVVSGHLFGSRLKSILFFYFPVYQFAN